MVTPFRFSVRGVRVVTPFRFRVVTPFRFGVIGIQPLRSNSTSPPRNFPSIASLVLLARRPPRLRCADGEQA
jgi:hypothetical protein